MKTKLSSPPRVASRDEWLIARKRHLEKEKQFTRLRDELSRERRELPWVKVENEYVFEGPSGLQSLADLFAGRGQLIVYHFMFGPGWEEGCKSCSFMADHFEGMLPHLHQRDVTLTAVSKAPPTELQSFQRRMGWKFPWVSSAKNEFNRDYHVSFTPEEMATGLVYYNYQPYPYPVEEAHGISVFAKDATGAVYHTYSSFARGPDLLLGTYNFLDLVPKGRDEGNLDFTMSWVRHHDRNDRA